MYRDHVIAAVVPAYREERLIATVITTMPAFVDHIIVVDDASPDATAQRAREVGDARVEESLAPDAARVAGSARAAVGVGVVAGMRERQGNAEPNAELDDCALGERDERRVNAVTRAPLGGFARGEIREILERLAR